MLAVIRNCPNIIIIHLAEQFNIFKRIRRKKCKLAYKIMAACIKLQENLCRKKGAKTALARQARAA
jgi:hypothetical protein